MDVLGWIGWLLLNLLGLAWSVAWFLLGGWVSTLAQVGVIVLLVFGYRYGWRRAPQEAMARVGGLGRFLWAWLRASDPGGPVGAAAPASRSPRTRAPARDQPGDVRINLSTTLSLLMLAGLWALAVL